MASNYSSDPNNISSMSNSALPQSGQGGVTPPSPNYGQAASTPRSSGSGSGGSTYWLTSGTELSGARYRIEHRVASGGMGAVYRAIDTRFKRPCAVKEMLDNFHNEAERAQSVEWFSREATLLLDLNHPCIPHVRDFFAEGGKHYLVMDFIEGRTLSQVLEQDEKIKGMNGAEGVPEARARSWAQQLCSVLNYLHNQNPPIIFRDLKPSNIMVTDREEIKLIDFGIARAFSAQRQSTVVMTVGYAAPEQFQGRTEPRSDIFSLGATLHKVLTLHDAANNQPNIFSFPALRTLRPDITFEFERVVMKSLTLDVEQRWASAVDMERTLINLPPITAVPVRPAPISSPNLLNNPTPTHSTTPAHPTASTTGPAGGHIIAAQGHLSANPPRVEFAYEEAKLAFGFEPNNALVHKIFGQVFARRVPPQPDLAIKAYNQSIKLNPNDAETHKLVGDISLFIIQQPANGIPAYIQSLRLNSSDFEAHQRLGLCYERTNQLEPALREYQEAARLAPKQPSVQFALGQLAMRLNQFPIAEQAFVQILFINPADHQTRFLLSQVYEWENKLEEAFRECSYVVGPLNTNPAVQQTFQRLRTRLGR